MAKRKRLMKQYEPGFLTRLDGRLTLATILNSSFEEIVEDLGGLNNLSHTKVTLVERFVFLEYLIRNTEERIAKEPKKIRSLSQSWIASVQLLTTLAKTLGLERQRKQIESLNSYVEDRKNGKRNRRK